MTTKKFSTIELPYPRYSIEVATFDISESHKENLELSLPSTCLPRFSHLSQVIEVRTREGLPHCAANQIKTNIENYLGSHIVIENARPELFLRRDFIREFVSKGTIFINHEPSDETRSALDNPGYRLTSKNNSLIIHMTPNQYRRFGMVATKVDVPRNGVSTGEQIYCIEIDLTNERLLMDNKYLDRMVKLLRRLHSINKIYFRFVPNDNSTELPAPDELCRDFFLRVVRDYELFPEKPVPLTNSYVVPQRIQRSWQNLSQLHPCLNYGRVMKQRATNRAPGEDHENQSTGGGLMIIEDKLERLLDVIDWLGYQLLSLDCYRDEIQMNYRESSAKVKSEDDAFKRLDVYCYQVVGATDWQHVQDNLCKLFTTDDLDQVVLRALIIHDGQQVPNDLTKHGVGSGGSDGPTSVATECGASKQQQVSFNSNSSCVIYLQNGSNGSEAANGITVLGISALGRV